MTLKLDRRTFLIASTATAGVVATSRSLAAKIARASVVGLKVDYIDHPLGLENVRPRLSWRLESTGRNVRQRAYRILVASSEAELKAGRADLWDSGKVDSRKSFGIQYRGAPLVARQRCWWRVEVWDDAGNAAAPSEPSWWEMGLLKSQDWNAEWLAVENEVMRADREAGLHWIWGATSEAKQSRKFRCKFTLAAAARASELLVVAAPSVCKFVGVWIDGDAVEGALSEDPQTRWLKLKSLGAGEHLLAIEVEPVEPPLLLAGLPPHHAFTAFARCELTNGQTQRIGSGTDWKTSLTHEADWRLPKYDHSSWEAARTVAIEDQPWPAAPAMYLRRSFALNKPVREARLYITALGAYEARLNGQRVGDALLTPEPSQYAKRALYQVFDVGALLQSGANALGVTVGDGWYGSWEGNFAWSPPPRRVLAQLELTFSDGSRQVVSTGSGWRTAESPIRRSEVRIGEVYDARFEQPGWDMAAFDDSRWQQAQVAAKPPCRLVAQVSPPIRVTRTLKSQAISQPRPGVHIFDFGQCFSGWCRLRTRGPRGSRIELKFAENLTAAGEIDQASLGVNLGAGVEPKEDAFILKGAESDETFEPHFVYRGFRYVQVTGLASEPTVDTAEGVFFHTDLEMTGQLRSDVTLLERIWRLTVETQRSNFVAIPTDCPSREQRGWMGDAGIFWDSAAFNMDVGAFTSRQMDNTTDDQDPNGSFPQLAPSTKRTNNFSMHASPPAWGDGSVILPWTAWRHYGDVAVIERNWDAMNRYLQFILSNNPDYVWRNKRGPDYGDWLAIGEVPSFTDPSAIPTTPKDLIGTAYWAHSADLLAQMSEAIGRGAEAKRLRGIFAQVRRAFNASFVKSDGAVGNGSQTSQVLALQFGLLDEPVKRRAVERLAADVRKRGIALTTGILGTQFILDVLAEAGFNDLAYGLLLRTENPSWGYMVRNGATTIWENWAGEFEYRKGHLEKVSQNHYALGAVTSFLFRRVAGIDTSSPGFENIVIRPLLDSRVKKAGADYDSIMGRISTNWSQNGDGSFSLELVVPANASARVHLPASPGARIREGRQEISNGKGIRVIDRSDREAVLEVGSGSYRFVVSN